MTQPRRSSPTGKTSKSSNELPKAPTGILGLDEVTSGGLPQGRPTLITGGPGCGKTLLALEFLIHGASKYREPGVFVTFEERAEDLAANARSIGHDLDGLIRRKRLAIEYIRVERSEIEETGEYDLEGLFIRLDHALNSIKAKRIVLDTIESLFAGLDDAGILRAELRRLFAWLKDRGITAVITGERGQNTLTRQGLEEYVSDCVIVLDHRVDDQVSTRRLRVVKYRGSEHGTNEYPFLIDNHGIAVLPITSLQLQHTASTRRISSGLDWLDAMFGKKGYYRGSSVLLSGGAGSGKTSFGAHFIDAACRRGERVLCFVFEESAAQYIRNMSSIGLDLDTWVKKGRLTIDAARPTLYGLEGHLAKMHRLIDALRPTAVVIDPLSSFTGGTVSEIAGTLIRMIDYLKSRQITALFTHLIPGTQNVVDDEVGVSSLMDTWLMLSAPFAGHTGGRHLTIVKSRGMAHSTLTRTFTITDGGVRSEAPAEQDGRRAGAR